MSILTPIKTSAKDTVLYLLARLFHFCIKAMPLFFMYRLAECISFIYLFTVKKQVDPASRELCEFAGMESNQKTVQRISQKACTIYVKRQMEDFIASKINAAVIQKLITITGRDELDKVLEKGKGGIILVSHFGSFRMILPALAYNGYKVNQLVGKPELRHHRKIHNFIFEKREHEYSFMPVRFIRTDLSIRPVIKALKNNELVVIAFDGREGNEWVDVPFLGRTGKLSAGPVRLAALTGASLIPTIIVRKSDDTHEVIIDSPFEIETEASREITAKQNTLKYISIFEKYIKQYPCHFAMTIKVHQERFEKGIIDVPMLV